MFYDENDNVDQTHIKIEFEPFSYLCSIFRVIILLKIWPLMLVVLNSIVLNLLQTFLLCWVKIFCCVKTRFELTDHKV